VIWQRAFLTFIDSNIANSANFLASLSIACSSLEDFAFRHGVPRFRGIHWQPKRVYVLAVLVHLSALSNSHERNSTDGRAREPKPPDMDHVVFILKCRRKALYQELRRNLGEVFRKLALQKVIISRCQSQNLTKSHVDSFFEVRN
jgi:hypothetical protein